MCCPFGTFCGFRGLSVSSPAGRSGPPARRTLLRPRLASGLPARYLPSESRLLFFTVGPTFEISSSLGIFIIRKSPFLSKAPESGEWIQVNNAYYYGKKKKIHSQPDETRRKRQWCAFPLEGSDFQEPKTRVWLTSQNQSSRHLFTNKKIFFKNNFHFSVQRPLQQYRAIPALNSSKPTPAK